MPLPARNQLAASTIGNSGYIYGGHNGGYLQDCDQYTPDTWTSKSDMPLPGRDDLAASTIGNSSYVYGGYDSMVNLLQDCDQYTPDTWVSKMNMSSTLAQLAATSM
jgi:N-acetylneuraminic acid mutarotase